MPGTAPPTAAIDTQHHACAPLPEPPESVRHNCRSVTSREWQGLGLVLLLAAGLRLVWLNEAGTVNSYYAAAVRSMQLGWGQFFFVAFDPHGFVAVDKPPVALWLQATSAKLLGYHDLSLLLPQVLAGLGAIVLLWHLVRRTFGPLAGLLSALVLTVTPIAVVADRTNELDSVMLPVLLLAAGAFLLATERGALHLLLLGAGLVGLAFNVKMLAAYLPLPAFYLPYLLAAPISLTRRVVHLTLASVVLLAVSLSWALAVQLTPPERRPYVGSTDDNSVLSLIVGHNGLERLLPGRAQFAATAARPPAPRGSQPVPSPSVPQPSGVQGVVPTGVSPQIGSLVPGSSIALEGGPIGPLRLFNQQLAGQASWLAPLALFGLAAAAWGSLGASRRLARTGPAVLLWSGWLILGAVLFSTATVVHRYYLVLLGPPLAALIGAGLPSLWQAYRWPGLSIRGWLLPLALMVTAVVQASFLVPYPVWSGRLTPLILGLSAVAAGGLSLGHLRAAKRLSRLAAPLTGLGCAALLVAPLTWAILSLRPNDPLRSVLPYAGPSGSGADAGSGTAAASGPGNPLTLTADPLLARFLEEQRDGAAFVLGVPSALIAAPLIVTTGQAVMAYGGFSGSDPILTIDQLAAAVQSGSVRFFMLPLAPPPAPGQPQSPLLTGISRQPGHTRWIREHCEPVPADRWRSAPLRIPPSPPAALPLGGSTPNGPTSGRSLPGYTLQLLDCGRNQSAS